MSEIPPLAGYTVAVTADRRREELGSALERRGARVVYGPAIRIVPLAADAELRAATDRCLAAPLDFAIATTGIGFRGWLDAAAAWGRAEQLHAALAGATILARGPKARGAVRAGNLREAWSPASESSSELLDHLLAEYPLAGARVALQQHGEPLPGVVAALREADAEVIEVPVYRWAPPEDAEPLRHVVEATATGSVDCVTFTSAPAAANFLRTADGLGRLPEVLGALKGPVLAAAVGSVTAEPLAREDVAVLVPERYRLGALAREVAEQLPARAPLLEPAGHRLQLRGHAVVLDDALVTVPAGGMALLRELAARPEEVISRDEPGVQAAVAELLTALGDAPVVQPVGTRGYRLAPRVAGATS